MSKTLIIVILDESGSMGNKKSDVLGGFNSFVSDQKQIKNDHARLYMVKFNTTVSIVHKGIDLADVPELTANNYLPGGMTALYDAIAEGVRLADKDKKEDERVICVIMTDGEENSSRETTKQQVKDIITGYQNRGDWTFIYIGENPDRWSRDAGMSGGNATNYDHVDTRRNYMMANSAVSQFRRSLSKQSSNLLSN
ncbi:uncharacterized protein LOC128963329 [Oppia nitens]|uniref:uncharacterized protein LOC128963329 n=1 Tax=Oppia nitens TaxID=1686743 RepID=UPI0023DB81F0|nr:uncharacterized protein LOC128963329 [Oppia nitens]